MNNLFLTVGSTRFDALSKTVTEPLFLYYIACHFTTLTLQYGNGDLHSHFEKSEAGEELLSFTASQVAEYTMALERLLGRAAPPLAQKLTVCWFRYKPDIQAQVKKADFVISHAGSGSILESLHCQKRMLVVVNDALMDNHQAELAVKLSQEGYLSMSATPSLPKLLIDFDASLSKVLKPFPDPDYSIFPKIVESLLN